MAVDLDHSGAASKKRFNPEDREPGGGGAPSGGGLRRVPIATLATAPTKRLSLGLHPQKVVGADHHREFFLLAALRRRSDLASGSRNRRGVDLDQAAVKA
jgi:hypothetical protein